MANLHTAFLCGLNRIGVYKVALLRMLDEFKYIFKTNRALSLSTQDESGGERGIMLQVNKEKNGETNNVSDEYLQTNSNKKNSFASRLPPPPPPSRQPKHFSASSKMLFIKYLLWYLFFCGNFLSSVLGDENLKIKVAVANYNPLREHRDFAEKVIERNVNEYTKLIEDASKQGVNITVFPEYGLTTDKIMNERYPNPYAIDLEQQLKTKPCFNHDKSIDPLIKLSCAAITHHMYVVVNLVEEKNETYFLSTIVFDNEGVIQEIYRKHHIPQQYNVFKHGENATIVTTKFGKFAIFSGYDLLLTDPATIKREKVDKIILTSSVESQYPFVHGPSLFKGASESNQDVVLMVSSLKNEKYKGSGIYQKGVLQFQEDDLIIADIPLADNRTNNKRSRRKIYRIKIPYSFEDDLECLHDLDIPLNNCNISVTFRDNNHRISYKKATCQNKNKLRELSSSSVCALVYCPNDVCQSDFVEPIRIKQIEINMKYSNGSVIQSLPVTLKSDNQPCEKYNYTKDQTSFSLKSSTEEEGIISFGILLIVNENDRDEIIVTNAEKPNNVRPARYEKSGTNSVYVSNVTYFIYFYIILKSFVYMADFQFSDSSRKY